MATSNYKHYCHPTPSPKDTWERLQAAQIVQKLRAIEFREAITVGWSNGNIDIKLINEWLNKQSYSNECPPVYRCYSVLTLVLTDLGRSNGFEYKDFGQSPVGIGSCELRRLCLFICNPEDDDVCWDHYEADIDAIKCGKAMKKVMELCE